MTFSKTTIAISKESRKELGKIKLVLEDRRKGFVDMDEVMRWLLQNIPADMKKAIS